MAEMLVEHLKSALWSQTDTHESRLQLHDGRVAMCVLSPKGAFQSFLLLSQHLPSPPSWSHMLALKPRSARKRRSKKAFFTLCTGPCSCAFGFQCDKGLVLAAAPSKLFHVLHIHPSCAVWALNPALGPGRASPNAVSQRLPQAGPRGRAWITEEGKPAGALACAGAVGSRHKNTCAGWERPAGLGGVQRGKRERPALRHATQLRQRVTALREKKRKKKCQAYKRTSRQSSCLVQLQR